MVQKSKAIILICIMFINTSCVTTALWDKKHYEVKDKTSLIALKGVYKIKNGGYCFLTEEASSYMNIDGKKAPGDCFMFYLPTSREYKLISTLLKSPKDFGVDSIDIIIDVKDGFTRLDFRVYVGGDGKAMPFTDEIFEGRQVLSEFKTDRHYFSFMNLRATLEESKSLGKLKKVKKSKKVPIAMYNKDDLFNSDYKVESQWKRVVLTPVTVAVDATLLLFLLIICIIDDGDDSSQWSFCWEPV